jgi:hypothetical protein
MGFATLNPSYVTRYHPRSRVGAKRRNALRYCSPTTLLKMAFLFVQARGRLSVSAMRSFGVFVFWPGAII